MYAVLNQCSSTDKEFFSLGSLVVNTLNHVTSRSGEIWATPECICPARQHCSIVKTTEDHWQAGGGPLLLSPRLTFSDILEVVKGVSMWRWGVYILRLRKTLSAVTK